jgi:hypothetical protein
MDTNRLTDAMLEDGDEKNCHFYFGQFVVLMRINRFFSRDTEKTWISFNGRILYTGDWKYSRFPFPSFSYEIVVLPNTDQCGAWNDICVGMLDGEPGKTYKLTFEWINALLNLACYWVACMFLLTAGSTVYNRIRNLHNKRNQANLI